MVVFPMMYPEVFDRFHITPPKGVLFHGPPGMTWGWEIRKYDFILIDFVILQELVKR